MRIKIPGDEKDQCYLCHRVGRMEIHHCLHGIRRKKADDYGLTVHLCPLCHRLLHDHGVGDLLLEQTAQLAFERHYRSDGREKWMKEFGKNYL